jgi:hypothetical protein
MRFANANCLLGRLRWLRIRNTLGGCLLRMRNVQITYQ